METYIRLKVLERQKVKDEVEDEKEMQLIDVSFLSLPADAAIAVWTLLRLKWNVANMAEKRLWLTRTSHIYTNAPKLSWVRDR